MRKSRQVGYPQKELLKSTQVVQVRCLSKYIIKCIWKMPPIAASYHVGASFAATSAQSLYFEQREIEGRSWWQNWPFLSALQLCCWIEDLKRIVWAPDQRLWKCRKSRRKPKRDRNGHFSFLKGSGGKFQVRRLIFALNALYYTPTHLWEVPQLNFKVGHFWPIIYTP